MAELTIQDESIDFETISRTRYKVEVRFKTDEKPDKILTFSFNPSLYMDKTIPSRSDLTFDKLETIINEYLEERDFKYPIDEIYDIKVEECNVFKRMENPGYKD